MVVAAFSASRKRKIYAPNYRFLPSSHSFFDVMIEPDASCLSKAEDGRNEAARKEEAAQRAG
jgi:hypothetical protein